MNWAEIFNAHNILLFLAGVIGLQLAKFFAKFVDGAGATWVQVEIKKLQDMVESTTAGKVLAQFHAEQALWKLVEDEIPVVFHKLSDDVQGALTSGDLAKVDWAAMGKDIWAGIRDKAQEGWVDYLQHSSSDDGAKLSAEIAQAIFSKLHMNLAIANANPPTPAVTVNQNPVTVVAAPVTQ